MTVNTNNRIETLGPAEVILNAITSYCDHAVHNRTGIVVPDAHDPTGLKWLPASWREKDGVKKVFRLDRTPARNSKSKPKTVPVEIGVLSDGNKVTTGVYRSCEFRPAGLFPEVVAHIYSQIARVWQLDNEFAARWASWALKQDHRDMKVILAAFMLVQNRAGQPVTDDKGKVMLNDDGSVALRDNDFRAVGEALLFSKEFNPKMILRVGEVLRLDKVAAINRKLGFGLSQRNAAMGRYFDAVTKWLQYVEATPKVLKNLVDKGNFKTTIIQLAVMAHYQPQSAAFYQTLRWKQVQSKTGKRSLGLNLKVADAESWDGLSEEAICEIIASRKFGFKRVVGMLPASVGLTRATLAAAIGAELLSDQDLLIYTETLEDFGLFAVPEVKERWERAVKNAENRRAANIALNVKNDELKEKLSNAADNAMKKAVEKAMSDREFRIYLAVDVSGSMSNAIERAKSLLAIFVQAFPLDRIHISIFNTFGRIVKLKVASAAGVAQAFKGVRADGGTDYSEGIEVFVRNKLMPKPDEDVIAFFVGDQEDKGTHRLAASLRKINTTAVAMLDVNTPKPEDWWRNPSRQVVAAAARAIGVPCFPVDEKVFADPYASVRTLRNLVSQTPVVKGGETVKAKPALTLVHEILQTPLASRPKWADVYGKAV